MTFADELRHVARGVMDVYDVDAGFPLLLQTCLDKNLFARPLWGEMQPPGNTPEDQLRWFVARMCADKSQGALLKPGDYVRLLYRPIPRVAWSRLSVGRGMTAENRLATYRVLWDVGIREIHNLILPSNPHSATMRAQGHYTFTPQGQYLHGVRTMTERP